MDKVTYRVKAAGCFVGRGHKSEAAAIKQAKHWASVGYESSVVYCSQSGTERSTMQVWPVAGQMYSEHR